MALPTLQQYNNIKDYLNTCTHGLSYEGWVAQYKPKREKKEVPEDDTFEAFWKEFPSSASFSHKGMKFASSRVLRSNKQVCQLLYSKIIATGIKPEQLIKAIQYQVNLMKEESWETGKNKLEYLNGCEVWLRQGKYEGLLEVAEQQEVENESDQGWA